MRNSLNILFILSVYMWRNKYNYLSKIGIIKIISTRKKLIQYNLFISMLVFYNSDKICSSKRNPKTYSHSQISKPLAMWMWRKSRFNNYIQYVFLRFCKNNITREKSWVNFFFLVPKKKKIKEKKNKAKGISKRVNCNAFSIKNPLRWASWISTTTQYRWRTDKGMLTFFFLFW